MSKKHWLSKPLSPALVSAGWWGFDKAIGTEGKHTKLSPEEIENTAIKTILDTIKSKLPEEKPDLRGIKYGEYRGWNECLKAVKESLGIE